MRTTEGVSHTRSYQHKAGMPLWSFDQHAIVFNEIQAYASLDAPEYTPTGGALACCDMAVVCMPIGGRIKS
jgi:hypothetical protein